MTCQAGVFSVDYILSYQRYGNDVVFDCVLRRGNAAQRSENLLCVEIFSASKRVPCYKLHRGEYLPSIRLLYQNKLIPVLYSARPLFSTLFFSPILIT